ncbi:MAG TPA: phosphoenolpyruvate synthase, partial [Desulfobulbaceae bacterium]|nr:phosphoenolpyruvate synthase [Desulfobulbaceae bacterium]
MTNHHLTPEKIESAALQANLQETAGRVVIHPRYQVLQDIVQRFQGLSIKLEKLLYEINHPYRNWQMIIPELRAFVLKNLHHYRKHPQGPEAFSLFTSIFLDALEESQKNGKLVRRIMEAMLAYTDKLINSMDSACLFRYQDVLNGFFIRLRHLDELDHRVMMFMVQGHHPMKKMALRLISIAGGEEKRESFDFRPIARLMRKILQLNYGYWLGEEDPLPWFEEQCGEYCADWQAGPLLSAISHARIRSHQQALERITVDDDPLAGLEKILQLPAHMDIVRLYRDIPGKL